MYHYNPDFQRLYFLPSYNYFKGNRDKAKFIRHLQRSEKHMGKLYVCMGHKPMYKERAKNRESPIMLSIVFLSYFGAPISFLLSLYLI